jgi:hypothetical protein
MNKMPVALFGSRAKAEPIQKRLVANGIQAEIHDELRLEKLWFVSKLEAGVRLEVPAGQFERAYEMLLVWDESEAALGDAIRCAECKSFRVEYPQVTQNSILPNLVVGFLAAVGHVEKEYYCRDCHFTWPKEGTKPSALRPHMAPYFFIEGVETTLPRPSEKGPHSNIA